VQQKMSKRDFLLEIGLEEMPARYVTAAMKQLGQKLEDWLKTNRITYGKVELFSTPRRLAAVIHDVADQQQDIEEEARGPAKKIALDQEGNWSKAATGFAKGQNVDVDDLYFHEIKGTEYVFVNKFIKGQNTIDLLPELREIILALHFPKTMRWGKNDLRYIRPIHWICALFGGEVFSIEITDVKSSNTTKGHRFLGTEVSIPEPSSYKEHLLGQFVIADPVERKESIRLQLENLEKDGGWKIPVDEDLLEEVNNLVEYPTAVTGSFDEKYLLIPEEVLITSMKEHQRYFPVKDKQGDLLPHFITFRNGDHKHLDNIAKGNEKVLRARLADAEFFYNEDQKLDLELCLKKLDKIVFHEELGSIGDKVDRIRKLTSVLCGKLSLNEAAKTKADRAAQLTKFDLVTHMVDEFPELQGLMGEKYARIFGEDEDVARAINEHYMPRFAGDQSPSSDVGAVVSLADKLDTIIGFFAIGVVPTGSQDPYGLRRQAAGIVQTLNVKAWPLPIDELITDAIHVHKETGIQQLNEEEVLHQAEQFFQLRLKNFLQERNVRYDIIDALLEGTSENIVQITSKAQFLNEEVNKPTFKEIVEALSRITNIARKPESTRFDADLFEAVEEKELYEVFQRIETPYLQALENGDMNEAFSLLASTQAAIDAYFDNIMVMADDQAIRENRLGFLAALSEIILSFAHFNKIVFK
jgi:glycyl-tRNA synthetase beta chain